VVVAACPKGRLPVTAALSSSLTETIPIASLHGQQSLFAHQLLRGGMFHLRPRHEPHSGHLEIIKKKITTCSEQ
jgi:hypothetical protein